VADPEPPPAAWMRDVTPDVTTNETRVTRLWVLVIDDALIPLDPAIVQASKRIVRDIIDKFSAEDLVAIVYTGDSRQAQDFTNDRAKLLATLDKFHPGLARWKNGTLQDPQFWLGAANTVLNVTETLVSIPHTRKAMIWVTPGVPANMLVPPGVPSGEGEAHFRIKNITQQIFAMAKRGNVPIYPIDPTGLMGLKAYITDGSLATPDEPTASWVLAMDHILMIAANTGGRPVVNTNDFTPGINNIFEENKSYYVLGYYPANAKSDGTLRRLSVKVNRPDVEIRTRDSYVAPKPGDGPPKNTNETLARATAAQVAVSELPLRATVAPFAMPGKPGLAAVTIALGVRQSVPESAAKERVTVTTELRTSAFTTEGDNRGTQRHTAKVVLRAGAQGDAEYEALSRINLPPGRYRLRLAAVHEDAQKTGTVMVDVVVPNFDKDVASMSGVVVGVSPGRPSAPRNLFADILPIIPSAQRTFTQDDQVTALFYLYQQAGRPMADANVTTRITNGAGTIVMDEKKTVAVDRFMAAQAGNSPTPVGPGAAALVRPASTQQSLLRAAEFQYPLPLSKLPTGAYLLTFDVTIGTTAFRRDVQFRILK
jgi:VWFA-related protein